MRRTRLRLSRAERRWNPPPVWSRATSRWPLQMLPWNPKPRWVVSGIRGRSQLSLLCSGVWPSPFSLKMRTGIGPDGAEGASYVGSVPEAPPEAGAAPLCPNPNPRRLYTVTPGLEREASLAEGPWAVRRGGRDFNVLCELLAAVENRQRQPREQGRGLRHVQRPARGERGADPGDGG